MQRRRRTAVNSCRPKEPSIQKLPMGRPVTLTVPASEMPGSCWGCQHHAFHLASHHVIPAVWRPVSFLPEPLSSSSLRPQAKFVVSMSRRLRRLVPFPCSFRCCGVCSLCSPTHLAKVSTKPHQKRFLMHCDFRSQDGW